MDKQFKSALYTFFELEPAAVAVDSEMFPTLDIFNSSVVERKEELDAEKCFECLTERQRQAFTLFYSGYTYKRIAETLGLSCSSVQIHIVRAREKLEQLKIS